MPRTLSFALLATLALVPAALGAQPTPPVAERRPRVDTLHGDIRTDDYFWIRNKSDPAVRAYLEAENRYAEALLAHTRPLQETLYNEMLGRIKQTDLSVPYRDNGFWYYTRTEEGKQYPILVRRRGTMDAPEQVMVDVNELAKGQEFMSLGAATVSDDGNLLAYSTDSTGFRQYTLRVRDLRTGRDLPDRREKVVTVAWAADNRTLFYTTEDPAKRSAYLWRHRLGDAKDELIYEEKDERFGVYVGRTLDRRFVRLNIGSLTTSETRLIEAAAPNGSWKIVAPRVQDREYDVTVHGDTFYIRVNDTGRNFRLVKAPIATPGAEHWVEVVPHRDSVMLEDATAFAGHMVLYERANGLPRLRIRQYASGTTVDIPFPEPVYSAFPSTNREYDTHLFRYSYQSFVTPSSVFDYDVRTGKSTLLKEQEVLGGYDRTQYQSERVFATATDGTRIPVSVVYRKSTPRDGTAPTLLTAYGSYGASSNVGFSSNRLSLLDRGVVFAQAHIRGGGDMGKAWHDAGRMQHKMNTFTDFIAAAEHLVRERYGAQSRLVIEGGSAGGLLMGAVTNLRPDLFRAVVSHVPFVDVVNTMLDETLPLTVGEFEEWGNPKKPDEYRWIKAYDPYTNLARKAYPAILVKTSFNDSQVMYHEPAKYVAKMRTMKTDTNPLLLVTNMGAGHGGASGRYDRLREIALDYAWMLDQMGVGTPATP